LSIITLMTDFGIKDGNVCVMKGVILGIAPQTQILDMSHVVAPQNVTEAALILGRSAPYFPAGTVHVVVVDPGVGTVRRPMAARLGTQFYVGPDNGFLTLCLERAEAASQPVEFVHLDRPQYWLPDVSYVFHGRDIFSPVAAALANGVPLAELGTPITDPVRLAFSRPETIENGLKGEVVHIDHFGNVASNIRVEHILEFLHNRADLSYPVPAIETLASGKNALRNAITAVLELKDRFSVRFGGVEIRGLVNTFGERYPGEVVALFGSTGNLIVSVVNGSFASQFDSQIGLPIELRFKP